MPAFCAKAKAKPKRNTEFQSRRTQLRIRGAGHTDSITAVAPSTLKLQMQSEFTSMPSRQRPQHCHKSWAAHRNTHLRWTHSTTCRSHPPHILLGSSRGQNMMLAQEKVKETAGLVPVMVLASASELVRVWGKALGKALELASARASCKHTQAQPCKMLLSLTPSHGPTAPHHSQARLGSLTLCLHFFSARSKYEHLEAKRHLVTLMRMRSSSTCLPAALQRKHLPCHWQVHHPHPCKQGNPHARGCLTIARKHRG